ncbi:serine/threonine-protein kinase [Streptomyces sp. MP131-18]|uniref:serine/threonine-protein kinase n=1 Tax=Streptomyces sp. MP131-18 TaxID=1857892 RepID=UPI0009C49456|nr:serine/threonine-protein kinase [Streptomyces sp. MP131-18]ONK13562.1 Serine/threonine-protein kinase AfsK [Streptomyces sp. MP131-18]
MDGLHPADPRQVGRYRLAGRLGAGGMGRVYLGRSPSGRLVAVKLVRPELAEDPGFRARFAREVAAARRVTGFFTAAVVDADPDGPSPWLATAYVPGLPLDEAVAAHGPWPVRSVRALGAGLAEALEAIHEAGLVHRDLKPSNVLIAPDGPRVVDFGISVAAEATALTRTGMVVGTPGFMAPEQLTGAPVTPATDVFALGAVLTYAATGTGPFGTGSAQALNFRIAYEEPDLGGLPPSGLEIVADCLAKDPARRPAVSALVEELAVVSVGDHPPTEIVPAAVTATADWLPGPVAQALPGTMTVTAPVAAPAAPARSAPPAPAPVAAPAAPPAPARSAAPPGASAAPGGLVLRRTFAYWCAIAVLVLAVVLPSRNGHAALTGINDGTGPWPFVLIAALNAATCGLVLAVLYRAPAAPVPLWARIPHTLMSVFTTGLFAYFLYWHIEDGEVDRLGPGAWLFGLGCPVLIYSVFRFRAPGRRP